MPKLPLSEQLDQAIQGIFTPVKVIDVDPGLRPLLKIAGELRNLPQEKFKARLKSELERKIMSATSVISKTLSAAPRLTFKDAAQAIEFYKQAFSAVETFRFETEAGLGHAEMRLGQSSIMFGNEWPQGGRYSAETLGRSPVIMTIQVEDVDAFVEHAVEAGAKLLVPPRDEFYGHRVATLLDPFGYSWNVSSVTEELSVDEMQRRFRAMMSSKTPDEPVRKGFHTVTPYLIAEDGPALLEFTKEAFGAEEISRGTGSAGGLHGEMRIGDSMIMIGGGIPGREFKGNANTHALHVYVEDVDLVYQKALAAGATSLGSPVDQDYGERSASIKDPAGNWWYIATHKGRTYVPSGLHNVNVYMHPLRADPLIAFLTRGFGATEIARYASPEGVVHHAQIRVGTSIIEMGEAHGPYQPMKSTFYLYVTDVDAVYRQAVAAGAKSLSQPADQPYGDRNAGVADVFGNTWYLATPIAGRE